MPPKKVSVRLMVPFSMQCTACDSYIYKSTKFNARKTGTGDDYLGVKIFQFEFRCSSCSGKIVFRTDPKSSGYQIVSGAREIYDQPTEAQVSSSTNNYSKSPTDQVGQRKARIMKLPKPKPRKHLLNENNGI